MTPNSRLLSVLLLLGLTVVSGLVQGYASSRWGPPDSSLAAADQLAGLPEQFGPWQMEKSEELGEQVTQMLDCVGYAYRTYVDQQTGDAVKMVVLLGPSGPTSVHDPEICYSGSGHTVLADRKRVTIDTEDGNRGEFWSVTLKSKDVGAALLHIYYGFSTGGSWQAVDNPRITYAARPYLYKIQVAADASPDNEEHPKDVCYRFLQDLIPAAAIHLVESD